MKSIMFNRLFAAIVAVTLLAPLATQTRLRAQQQDIVDTAVAAGSFNTLAKALQAAGLVDTLKGKGPFTVFAPTDAAFAKLPAGTLDDLLKPENKQKLTEILTYHVVSGKVAAADVTQLKTCEDRQWQVRPHLDRRRVGDGRRRQGGESGRDGVERRHPCHRLCGPPEVSGVRRSAPARRLGGAGAQMGMFGATEIKGVARECHRPCERVAQSPRLTPEALAGKVALVAGRRSGPSPGRPRRWRCDAERARACSGLGGMHSIRRER